jgi:serine/threonine protein kinase
MSSTDPLIGKRLGDYLIEGVQGTGGMARVYRGYDEKLDRYAAVKVIEPQLVASAEEEEYRERFLREARSIARLSHPRVVGIYQFGQMDNLYYIAMEYIEGRNLRELLKGYLKQGKYMPVPDVIKVLKDIGDALDYAHKQNIIHRDVKPSNIIVNSDGTAILTDFGLALNALEGTIGNTFGSVHYIAPEQAISSAQAVAASDQYSLAIIGYEMLTGRVPFDDASAMSVALKHISDPPPPPRELNPDIPVDVEVVLIKALDKDTGKRYSSCNEFVYALQAAYSAAEERPTSPAISDSKPTSNSASQSAKSASHDIDAPTITDTASRPQSGAKSGTAAEAKTTPGPTISSSPIATPGSSRTGFYVLAAVVVIALVAGAIVLFPKVLGPGIDTDATSTVMAQTQVVVLQITNTAEEARIQAALEGTSNARMTSTADALATDVALAALDTDQTATAQADVDATASAEAGANETATNEVALTLTATSQDVASIQGTATGAVLATGTAAAEIAATQTQTALPAATNTHTPLPSTPTDTPSLTFTATVAATNTPAASPTPGLQMVNEEDAQLLLIYDGTSLSVYNRAEEPVDYLDLEFYQFAPDENGKIVQTERYRAFAWLPSNRPSRPLNSEQCVQIWDADLGITSGSVDPMDFCEVRVYYQTMPNPFWLSSLEGAYFEVRRGAVDVIATCPVTIRDTRRQTRCEVDIRLQ